MMSMSVYVCLFMSLSPELLLLHPLNGPFSRTTWVSQCQKGKTSLDSNEARVDVRTSCLVFTKFLVTAQSPGGSAICYKFPVLWITSYLPGHEKGILSK